MRKIDKFIDTYISMLNDNIIIEDDQQSNILAKVYRELIKIKVRAPKIRMSSNKTKANANDEAGKITKSDEKTDGDEFIIENEEVLKDIETARNKFKEDIENITSNCKNMKTFLSEKFLKDFSKKINELNTNIVKIIEGEKKEDIQNPNNNNNNNESVAQSDDKPKRGEVDVTIKDETDNSETKN